MSERREPQFNPEQLKVAVQTPIPVLEASQSVEEPTGGGFSVLTTLIMLILAASVLGLGWLYVEQGQTLAQQQREQTQLLRRLDVVEQQLQLDQAQTQVALQDLPTALARLDSRLSEQLSQTQQRVEQLATREALAPTALAPLQADLKGQAEQVAAVQTRHTQLAEQLQALTVRVDAADSVQRLDALNAHIETLQAAQRTLQQAQESGFNQQRTQTRQLQQTLEGLEQRLSELGLLQTAEQERRQQLANELSQMRRQVEGTASGAGSAELNRLREMLAQHEQAIAAIDGSRVQVNRELLQLRQQVNDLRLTLGR